MSERGKIKQALQKKEQEIQNLESRIKTAKVYVRALHDILKMLKKSDNADAAETTLRQGSAVAQARDVILDCGIPVHMNDLLSALGKTPSREASSSLGSSLAAYVRRGEIFSRTAPNTFGLIELGHKSDGEEPPEPPAGFGSIPSQSIPDDDEIQF